MTSANAAQMEPYIYSSMGAEVELNKACQTNQIISAEQIVSLNIQNFVLNSM